MKNGLIWKILLVIGLCPFVFPLIIAFTSDWTVLETLLAYSIIFFPTYIIGFILLIVSICKIRK